MSGKRSASPARTIRAPRGSNLSCKGWHQEAAMRMLMNNLDPDVAENPDQLIVYGGTGRAARSWDAFDAIVRSLRELKNDESLLIQSGKPVGKFRTHDEAPRVLIAHSIDEALKLIDAALKDRQRSRRESSDVDGQAREGSRAGRRANQSISVGLVGNCADVLPEIVKRGVVPDVLTDQTSAHDALNGYVPHGMSLEDALALRRKDPDGYIERAMHSMAVHVEAMLALQKKGAITFDYGNNIRAQAQKAGVKNAFEIPGFVPEYIRPLFCEGRGPFRWVALSGDPADIARTDKLALELFPKNQTLARWMKLAKERIHYQGLPARICWLGYGERAEFGVAINELVKSGEIKAPIVIGRDHLDTGSVASPNRETEGMLDGSDAIADWPLLNALVNTAAGASWVSIHNGGGVGIGFSQHAGMVVVADGTENSKRRLDRVLTSDPGMGILRHVDAAYSRAIEFASAHDIGIPMKPQPRD